MSNRILNEINDNSIKLPTKSIGLNSNALWNSPIVRDKSQYHQQQLSQLKHRQNEFKLKLAIIKIFLSMDENKNFAHYDSVNSTTISNSLMHPIILNTYGEEVNELEKDIEHLEKRLASTKPQ